MFFISISRLTLVYRHIDRRIHCATDLHHPNFTHLNPHPRSYGNKIKHTYQALQHRIKRGS